MIVKLFSRVVWEIMGIIMIESVMHSFLVEVNWLNIMSIVILVLHSAMVIKVRVHVHGQV